MNKYCFIIITLLHLHCSYKAQNLVLNPSFEDHYNCPNLILSILECKNVFNPVNISTPDFFNSCAPVYDLNVPYTLLGFQDAQDGNSYLGIAVSDYYQEYVQIKLSNTLTANKTYSFMFYVSLANQCNYATSAIDLKFVSDSILYPSFPLDVYLIPDWSNPKGNFLKDTLNWMKLSGTYKAKGNEQWIILGSFHQGVNVDTLKVNSNGINEPYYYIDGFSLEEKIIVIPNVFTPNGDNSNDIFFIDGLTEDETIYIYNRWGEEIINIKGNQGWDGTTKNKSSCSDGVYYCVVKSNQNVFKTEFIQLLR